MTCPHCNHTFPLAWSRYFRSPMGKHTCPSCHRRFKLKLTLAYCVLLFAAWLLYYGVAISMTVVFFPAAWESLMAVPYGICILAVGSVILLPLDRLYDDRFREVVKLSDDGTPMTTTFADQLWYAGFWPRLGALLLDTLIMLPLTALVFLGSERYRLFDLYCLVPSTLFSLFYGVYLVRRFGGTPGKLIVGVRIRKVSGEPVGYREAFLRYLPEFVLGTLMSIALLIPVMQMSDAEYHAIAVMERAKRIIELAPSWYKPLPILLMVWVWGELIVLLTNRKRRALHDFIAGTVVVRTPPNQATDAVQGIILPG